MAETLDQLDPKVIILFTPKRRLQHLPPKGCRSENHLTEERSGEMIWNVVVDWVMVWMNKCEMRDGLGSVLEVSQLVINCQEFDVTTCLENKFQFNATWNCTMAAVQRKMTQMFLFHSSSDVHVKNAVLLRNIKILCLRCLS